MAFDVGESCLLFVTKARTSMECQFSSRLVIFGDVMMSFRGLRAMKTVARVDRPEARTGPRRPMLTKSDQSDKELRCKNAALRDLKKSKHWRRLST